jgi:hypothetical protein
LDGPEEGETRVAIVMVSGFERGCARLRLAQDFGRPEDETGLDQSAKATTAAAPPPALSAPAAFPAREPPAGRPARLPGRRSKMA